MDKNNDKITEEVKTVVAKRNPPGDLWIPFSNRDIVLDSLTDCLEYIYQEKNSTQFYIDATEGYIYTIDVVDKVIESEPPKKYSLYGEH